MLDNFEKLVEQVRAERTKTIAIAMAEDHEVLSAIEKARSTGLVKGLLTGQEKRITEILKELQIDAKNYTIIDAQNEIDAVKHAVKCVQNGDAQVVMKGLCSTSVFLRGVLDKEYGLRSGKVLSHLALFESPFYHKIFCMSDAALNIAPDLVTKIAITENAITAAHNLGLSIPKVAIISAIEKVNPESMPSSSDAAIIAKMAERGQLKSAVVDGPLAIDNALSKESCDVKGLKTPVGGDADICIVPNIETGNVFYKLLTVLGGAKVAGIVVGARTPIVLTSRADSDESKFLSIATALRAC
jgi:phosphate butyryltransferase